MGIYMKSKRRDGWEMDDDGKDRIKGIDICIYNILELENARELEVVDVYVLRIKFYLDCS